MYSNWKRKSDPSISINYPSSAPSPAIIPPLLLPVHLKSLIMSIRDSPTKVEILPPGDEGESSKPKTPDLLLSEDGLGYGLRYFLKSFKYRGRGKEVSDLGNLIRLHSEWHSHLLPYYSFDQFVHKGATSRFVSRPLPKPKRSVKSGKVYGVASEDMDSLSFGAPKFLRHLMDPSSRKIPVMEFEVAKILQELQLTMDQFIDVCILSGCDYCDSIREDQISCDGFPYV